MRLKKWLIILFLSFAYNSELLAQSLEATRVDVLGYHVYLEPNLSEQTIKGNVLIKFKASNIANKIVFDSGQLEVTKIEGDNVKGYEQKGRKTIISLFKSDTTLQEIRLFYKGKPKRGLVFLDAPQQLYSVFQTSEWMICNMSPDDRATLKFDLLVPKEFNCIASGVLKDSVGTRNNKTLYSWDQDYETPAYTYGFTIGSFKKIQQKHDRITLNFYANKHTADKIEKIFQYTGDMISFFEEKAGVPLPQSTYSQILIGNHYQEMSGFAILKQSYGNLVLKDSMETNLISHELAHQWWGNSVTCKNWNHFWLNEGFATFMSVAYNEHRFGKEKYLENINAYAKVYEAIKKKGADKSLVFKDWLSPSTDDRNLVYCKGAYVLFLLKEELGDETFWEGIKHYTQKYFGKSVITKDFQLAMEESTNKDLSEFFNRWVY